MSRRINASDKYYLIYSCIPRSPYSDIKLVHNCFALGCSKNLLHRASSVVEQKNENGFSQAICEYTVSPQTAVVVIKANLTHISMRDPNSSWVFFYFFFSEVLKFKSTAVPCSVTSKQLMS